ncbi:MAG: Holliday junction branch migration protein RuvA [Bacteroidetes bacterium]|nr:Holliday junction branch migration protein RuvA [Bacteroidota bacterium]
MFAYLEGELRYKSPSLLHLDVNGVGYELAITLQTYTKIQHLERARLLVHLQIREDAWVLYGFADEAERSTFRSLLGISGIGAGTARIVLSSLTPAELEQAVASDNATLLQAVKGIGAKTAQRIVLELKGKLQSEQSPQTTGKLPMHNTKEEDAFIALMNLGISRSAAAEAIRKAGEWPSVEQLIKAALKVL